MCIKVHQRQWSVVLRVRLEHRVGDVMIAAERQRRSARRNDFVNVLLDFIGNALGLSVVEIAIAIIDDRQFLERVGLPGPGPRPGNAGADRANRARAESGAGAISCGHIQRDARDGNIDAIEVLAVLSAQETQRAAVAGRMGNRAFRVSLIIGKLL